MRRILAICALCACAFALVMGLPATALAANGSYSVDELSTEITVQTDASAIAVERQVVTFENQNAGMVWYLRSPSGNESVRINSVRVAPVDDGGTPLGEWTRLQMIDTDPKMQGQWPGDTAALGLTTDKTQPWYSYNISDGMLRCWFPTSGNAEGHRTYAVEVNYTVYNCVYAYRDVGELYWRYVHDSLPSSVNEVNLQVKLPAPEGATVKPGEDVLAWGHGPDGGTFDISANGTVTYHLDHIARGYYAEAHLIFPASWLTNLPEGAATGNQFADTRRTEAIDEESEWVDAAMREANWDNKVRVLFLCLAVAVILVGTIGVIRRGRSPLARRALIRTAATLGIMALAEKLLFREPLAFYLLLALAAVVAFVSLVLPTTEEPEETSNEEDK